MWMGLRNFRFLLGTWQLLFLLLFEFIALQFVGVFELFAITIVLLDNIFVYSSNFGEDPRQCFLIELHLNRAGNLALIEPSNVLLGTSYFGRRLMTFFTGRLAGHATILVGRCRADLV